MEHGTNWTPARIGKTALTFAAAAIGAALLALVASCGPKDYTPPTPHISGPESGFVGVPV